MRHTPTNPALLLRYADAAGYGAVSFVEDEPAAPPARTGFGFWRAFLLFVFVIV